MSRHPQTHAPTEDQARRGQDFFHRVWDVVRLVPPGRVTTYGAIANYLGAKGSARTVGYAMNAATAQPPTPGHPPVPAQRVVNRLGLLSGKHHFGTPTRMQELLAAEGVPVEDDRVTDFATRFWDPAKELDL